MTPPIDSLPDDLESLKRLLTAERAARLAAEEKAVIAEDKAAIAEAAAARAVADVSSAEAVIACGFRFNPAGYSDAKAATIPT